MRYGKDRVAIDLGAEKILAATRGTEKIAVEIKTFSSESELSAYHAALGQVLNYRVALQKVEPERTLYLAVPVETYKSLFSRELPIASVQAYQAKLVVYDPAQEVITQWQP